MLIPQKQNVCENNIHILKFPTLNKISRFEKNSTRHLASLKGIKTENRGVDMTYNGGRNNSLASNAERLSFTQLRAIPTVKTRCTISSCRA